MISESLEHSIELHATIHTIKVMCYASQLDCVELICSKDQHVMAVHILSYWCIH